jgi:hypothetical protein
MSGWEAGVVSKQPEFSAGRGSGFGRGDENRRGDIAIIIEHMSCFVKGAK